MKGDFTRDTFDPAKYYSRVLMQQGRVTVDADWNEQISILLNTMRTMATDIIGPFAGPVNGGGFTLASTGPGDLTLSAGRYYVDGILIENDFPYEYVDQPNGVSPTDAALVELGNKTPSSNTVFWFYLDVWEWHLNYISDGDIREVALNGADTCTRSKVIWQAKSLSLTPQQIQNLSPAQQDPNANQNDPVFTPTICQEPLASLLTVSSGQLGARVDPGVTVDCPCVTPPSAKYRGAENQLYRVEVHTGGAAGTATFKWSRDNGSVVTAFLGNTGGVLSVSNSRGFAAGNWVELLDDNFEMLTLPGALVKLSQVGNGTLTVDLSSLSGTATKDNLYSNLDPGANPRIRRWDQIDTDSAPLTGGAVPLVEGTEDKPTWINLEDGVQVAFAFATQTDVPSGGATASVYRTGDYWLIPARVASGNVEWPTQTDILTLTPLPLFMPPDGIEHHFAPLGYLTWSPNLVGESNTKVKMASCLCSFEPIGTCSDGANAPTPVVRTVANEPIDFQAKEQSEIQQTAPKRQVRRAAGG